LGHLFSNPIAARPLSPFTPRDLFKTIVRSVRNTQEKVPVRGDRAGVPVRLRLAGVFVHNNNIDVTPSRLASRLKNETQSSFDHLIVRWRVSILKLLKTVVIPLSPKGLPSAYSGRRP
jgi:hypothetical protein